MMFSMLAQLLQVSSARRLLGHSADSVSGVRQTGVTGFNNSCLVQNTQTDLDRDGPREFDCAKWVIESTDQIWNMYRGNTLPIGL